MCGYVFLKIYLARLHQALIDVDLAVRALEAGAVTQADVGVDSVDTRPVVHTRTRL